MPPTLRNPQGAAGETGATGATGPGFVTVWPGGERPVASNLNVTAQGQNIPNLAIVGVSPSGSVSLYSQSGGHLVVDLNGYYIGAG